VDNLDKILQMVDNDPGRIKTDSREVCPGDLFIALKGPVSDGHDYIGKAIENGASKIIFEDIPADIKTMLPEEILQVEDSREVLSEIASRIYDDPSSKLNLYGITGTNGKTTTAILIRHGIEVCGRACGLISTVYNIVDKDDIIPTKLTTPDILTINSLLNEMVRNNKKAAILEISSHSLSQKRVEGIKLDAAIFTNITPEHLDYHLTIENYMEEKLKIFSLLKPGRPAIINVDDNFIAEKIKDINSSSIITFGIKNTADIQAKNIELMSSGTVFDCIIRDSELIKITTRFIGIHNVYNILAAIAVLLEEGLNPGQIQDAIYEYCEVPGRLQRVSSTAPFEVFVDYAHTSDAIKNVLKALKPLTENRLIIVFGCGGDRDKTKRKVMGEIASKYADQTIITDDNPRSENPDNIRKEIEKGMLPDDNYSIIPHREEAIKTAINMGETGDVIVIAGKGHEDYQIIGNETKHFDDREVAREAIEKRGF
jgi:UDP-N-acetylmuramoyl-L-alanyl-D-glutamate--2,6-diaminopimelate ligase